MAANLPRELLFLIMEHLRQDSVSLLPYARVCRTWQSVFESFIFSTVTIYSGNDSNKAHQQKGISLEEFNRATSGHNSARRAWIREVRYDILVPYELLDWTSVKDDTGYTVDNPIRRANDEAFQAAIASLFTVLSTWDQTHRLALTIGLLECKQGLALEPNTWDFAPEAGAYRFDYRDGRTQSVPPYRARLSDPSALVPAPCVEKLTFANVKNRVEKKIDLFADYKEQDSEEEDPALDPRPRNRWHQVWAEAVFQIAASCPTITELHLNLHEYVRPDHIEYIQDRRAAVAEGLQKLPTSLRLFDYAGHYEEPWKDTMPALNVLKTGIDILATTLRGLTIVLRELRLDRVRLSTDFLWPLDGDSNPIANPSYCWPNLESLIMTYIPPFTPEGKWLTFPDADEQRQINEVSDWEAEICNSERGYIRRQVLDTEQFHRLFISWGYAARHAPRITTMKYHLKDRSKVDFSFTTHGEKANLHWKSRSSYRPDHRVARAWGFGLDALVLDESRSVSVSLPRWPPAESS
ncbi:hypothetical protein BJX63DRAFT_424017 [Aspergillus granulosus]|uniref:F-box domain-containing protein n=1 Tax=Aspergillus granulosus TaxID=176169 RepID=A0ABR4H179_9EURO